MARLEAKLVYNLRSRTRALRLPVIATFLFAFSRSNLTTDSVDQANLCCSRALPVAVGQYLAHKLLQCCFRPGDMWLPTGTCGREQSAVLPTGHFLLKVAAQQRLKTIAQTPQAFMSSAVLCAPLCQRTSFQPHCKESLLFGEDHYQNLPVSGQALLATSIPTFHPCCHPLPWSAAGRGPPTSGLPLPDGLDSWGHVLSC